MPSVQGSTRRRPGRGALLATLLLIFLATLTPGQRSDTEGRPHGHDRKIADILLNVALFAPLGAVLGHHGRSASQTLVLGALLSGAIEIAQLAVPGRFAGFEDVVFDTVGTMAGWVLDRTSPIWVRPDRKVAGLLSLAAACMASTVLAVTGLMLQPSFPAAKYFGGWTHEFGHLHVYRGQVLEASLG